MKSNQASKTEIILTLFIDDSAESKQAIEALNAMREDFRIFDVRSLNMVKGDEIEPPTLFAPEGIFRGWRQIRTFVNIPPNMRYRALAAHP
jgi:hypothetical protein